MAACPSLVVVVCTGTGEAGLRSADFPGTADYYAGWGGGVNLAILVGKVDGAEKPKTRTIGYEAHPCDQALDLPAADRDAWLNRLSQEYTALKPTLRVLLARHTSERWSSPPRRQPGPGEVHDDGAHYPRRVCKEMGAVGDLDVATVEETKERFVRQRSGIQQRYRLMMAQLGMRQSVQFTIHQAERSIGSFAVALPDRGKQRRKFAHGSRDFA